jgi:hypothetical protein
VQLDFNNKGNDTQINSLYDLIGASVTVPGKKAGDPSVKYNSPLNQTSITTLLPPLLDKATTKQGQVILGRVNVNTASEAVLTALFTGVLNQQSDAVQAILGTRPQPSAIGGSDPIFQTPAWLMSQGGLTANQMSKLDPYITTSTQVYRFQVLGYFDEGHTFARVEAVVYTNNGRPRVLYQRDLSDLGKGFDLSQGQ